ncbi:MAG: conjugal transfer protein TraX [Eubacterium sp.]|nr:conjugal transfer protein TraX [Eubacterium sp.]
MLIDHIGAVVLEKGILLDIDTQNDHSMDSVVLIDMLLRIIGRVAFPIFCFLLIEGYIHTRSKLKYMLRLLIFGLVSEIPFDIATNNSLIYFEYQNVYFTLLLGIITLYLWDLIIKNPEEDPMKCFKQAKASKKFLAIITLIAMLAIAILAHTDYDATGVFLIFVLYFFRFKRAPKYIISIFTFILASILEIFAALSFIAFEKYNGKRGLNLKYVFYVFYPAHLLILVLIRYLVCGVGIN